MGPRSYWRSLYVAVVHILSFICYVKLLHDEWFWSRPKGQSMYTHTHKRKLFRLPLLHSLNKCHCCSSAKCCWCLNLFKWSLNYNFDQLQFAFFNWKNKEVVAEQGAHFSIIAVTYKRNDASDDFFSYLWTQQILISRCVSTAIYSINALRNTNWLNTNLCNWRCSDNKQGFKYEVRPFPMPPLGEELMFQPRLPWKTLKEYNNLETFLPSFPLVGLNDLDGLFQPELFYDSNNPMHLWWDWVFVSAGGKARGKLWPPGEERTSCVTTFSTVALHVQEMSSLVCNFIENLSLTFNYF